MFEANSLRVLKHFRRQGRAPRLPKGEVWMWSWKWELGGCMYNVKKKLIFECVHDEWINECWYEKTAIAEW